MKKYNGEQFKKIIIEAVCDRYLVKFEDMLKVRKIRKRGHVKVRQLIMYFLGVFSDMTNEDIGYVFGKCHATYNHSFKTVKNLAQTNSTFKRELDELYIFVENRLKNAEIINSGILDKSINQIFDACLTVGELRAQLSKFADNVSFGFRNQPMQVLYHIKYDDFEALVFQ